MLKNLAVVAALLLAFIITNVATAAENPEHFTKLADAKFKSKKSEKILKMIKAVGISDPDITNLVNQMDERTKDGYLTLHQEKIDGGTLGGTLSLRYELHSGVKVKQLELRYAPDNSNMEYTARKSAVMANYKFKF